MKHFTKPFLEGFGSVLSLYPRKMMRLSMLRETYFPQFRDGGSSGSVEMREADAKKLREAIELLTRSSEELEQIIKRGEVRRETLRHDALDSQHALEVKLRRSGSKSRPPETFSVYADHLKGIGDMLAIRRDWQMTSKDLSSAKETALSQE